MNDLQEFLESHCPSACVNVDLFAVARDINSASKKNHLKPLNGRHPPVSFLLDGECCLDRLYGGYYNDWVCGGHWSRMLEFISQLSQTLQRHSIRITVVLNGTNETSRKDEWIQQQLNDRQKINNILSHVLVKATPPPKVWWIPPACMRTCLRMALYFLKFECIQTLDNHYQEAMRIYFEHGFQGLIADNPEYIVFNPGRYFSSKNLKLTFKGSYETKEFVLPTLVSQLKIDPGRLGLLMALAGNFMLTKAELLPFHQTLVDNFKESNLLLNLARFVQALEDPTDLDKIGNQIFGLAGQHLTRKFRKSVEYYHNAAASSTFKGYFDNAQSPESDYMHKVDQVCSNFSGLGLGQDGKDAITNAEGDSSSKGKSMKSKPEEPKLPKVAPEIMAVCQKRHMESLMHPWIYHVFSKGEIRIPVYLEEEMPGELPSVALFYQPLRAAIYGILFDSQHNRKKKIVVREWLYTRANPYQKAEPVAAICLSDYPMSIPRLQQLWLGGSEYKNARMHAFLSCMRSDTPLMMDRNYVPEALLLFCSVLRYILKESTRPLLTRQELEAFLIQAVDPDLQNTEKTMKMEIPVITVRGIQVAALFMAGVEHAILANDACGAPIQSIHCLPWTFFNGKLFQMKLHKIMLNNNLIALCNGQIDQVSKVEFLRRAVMEGIQPVFAHPTGFLPPTSNRMAPPPPPPSMPSYNPRVMPHGGGNSRMMARGGQLEVAGVVVSNWGANYGNNRGGGASGPRFPPPPPPSQQRGGGVTRGSGRGRPVASPPKPVKQQNAKRGKTNKNGFGGGSKNPSVLKSSQDNELDDASFGRASSASGVGRGCTIEHGTETVHLSKILKGNSETCDNLNAM